MRRRSFFSAVGGAIAALFANPTTAQAAGKDHTKPDEYDPSGEAICRIYRQVKDGTYRQIQRSEIRVGDRILMVGQNGDRLFMCREGTVAAISHEPYQNGGYVPDDSKGQRDLLMDETPPAVQKVCDLLPGVQWEQPTTPVGSCA